MVKQEIFVSDARCGGWREKTKKAKGGKTLGRWKVVDVSSNLRRARLPCSLEGEGPACLGGKMLLIELNYSFQVIQL